MVEARNSMKALCHIHHCRNDRFSSKTIPNFLKITSRAQPVLQKLLSFYLPFLKHLLILICFQAFAHNAFAQFSLSDTIPYQKKKITVRAFTSATVYTISMVGLNEVWYKENARNRFHFFNDNREWKQVDKVGHFYSSFYISALSARSVNQCGISSSKSALIGTLTGFAALLTIEVFDGYSAAYGASAGDLLANAGGSSFYWLQQNLWNEVRLQPKFSFHRSDYASLRPTVLGDSFSKELLKDYNGQTYWLSIDVDTFIRFPKWLNLAVGYGAEKMIYARDNQNQLVGFTPIRQYYLAFDLDLTSINTRSRFLKSVFTLLSAIKFPAPTCTVTKEGISFHPFYF